MIWNVDPVIFYVFNYPIKYYSLCWMVAFICGLTIAQKVMRKIKWPEDILDPFFSYVIIGTAVGARLGHCLFYDFEYFSRHVLEIFLPIQFTSSGISFTGYVGLASHGATIGIELLLKR